MPRNALNILRRVERAALAALFLSMVGLYFVNIAVRISGSDYATKLFWIDEAVRLLMLFLVFLALGLALEQGRHVGVFTWRDRIAASTRLPLRRLIDVAGLVFSAWMAWLALRMTLFVIGSAQIIPSLGISAGWLYVAPAIGFATLALRFALSLSGLIDRFTPQMHEADE